MDWFVFYTKARWEKKVSDYLIRFGYEPFLPLVTEVHQWSDRKKKVVVPLFRSYIFVNSTEDKIPDILKIPGISWAIKVEGKPAVLSGQDKEKLDRVLQTGYTLEEHLGEEVTIGDKVEIIEGPLSGLNAEVLKSDKNSVLVRINSIDKNIRLFVPPELIKKN